MSENVRAKLLIKGLVQGVFFRYSTSVEAKKVGVTGWVRNVPGGDVEALVEGDREKVQRLIDWCHVGPPASRVDKVTVEWEEYRGEFSDFSISY